MPWPTISAFQPSLPAHCEPTSDFLIRFSSTFQTCVPTPLAFASNTLGLLSIVAWLFAQLPQIYKNWSISSTSGLSIIFLVEWCLGDISNLLGALFTHQASWQVAIGSYYVFVDVCLVCQWLWYEKLRHGQTVRRVWAKSSGDPNGPSGGGMHEVVIEGVAPYKPGQSGECLQNNRDAHEQPKQATRAPIVFRTPTFRIESATGDEKPSPSSSATPNGTTIYRVGPSSPLPSPSPRTVLLIACLAIVVQASPVRQHSGSESGNTVGRTHLETAGTILSWMSTLLYLGSRLPQLYKNFRRKSTAGLSPHLFAAAFCGNLLYSSALLTNPSGWYDFGPYGGGGWAGPEGSDRVQWVTAALPFFLGAAGVLGLDASVGVQFLLYGEGDSKVVVVEGGSGKRWRWRWRRVSGWMRGWVPSISEGKREERDALLERSDQHGEGYGAL